MNDFTNEQEEVIVEKEDMITELKKMHKELMSKLDRQDQRMNTMQGTLDKIVSKLDDRAVPPSDEELSERFVLMKKDQNTFYVIRSQERRLSKAILEREKNNVQI